LSHKKINPRRIFFVDIKHVTCYSRGFNTNKFLEKKNYKLKKKVMDLIKKKRKEKERKKTTRALRIKEL
jgi:predicted amidophosphoribosyltransferase